MKCNNLWCNKLKFIQKFWKGESFAYVYTVCGHNQFWCKMSDWKLRPKSSESWTVFFWFRVEHSLPLSAAVHASELFRNMFSDSKIASKYWCGLTKTTYMLAGAVTKQITSDLKEELLLALWNGLATDGSSNEGDKFLFFLVKTCW